MEIKGCVALVTGANRGLGEAFVRALLDAGASKVYAGSRVPEACAALVEEFHGRCVALELDVTDLGEVAAAAASCADVNLLINNAGVLNFQLLIGAQDMSAARQEMEVNYFGPLSMCRAFAPVLAYNAGGAIVNVLSVGALVDLPHLGGYSASKAAARAMTAGVRAELADQGTHVVALMVGSADTRMTASVEDLGKGNPQDIARVALKAVRHGIDEIDTDRTAVDMRAALALDPKGLERRLAKLLKPRVSHRKR